jgi:hypothetical protein
MVRSSAVRPGTRAHAFGPRLPIEELVTREGHLTIDGPPIRNRRQIGLRPAVLHQVASEHIIPL